MTRARLVVACGFVVACGPAVPVGPGDDESGESEDSTGEGGTSTSSSDTGRDPVSTTGSRLDVGRPEGRVDGPYLLAFAAVIDSSKPFQWIATTRMNGGLMDLVLQPLSLDVGSTTAPRLPVGEPLIYSDVPVEGGCFSLDMGPLRIAGETNPITGADLEATIVLDGCFELPNYCGTATGQVSMPLMLDLAGSTFAAIEVDPAVLPVDFPSSC